MSDIPVVGMVLRERYCNGPVRTVVEVTLPDRVRPASMTLEWSDNSGEFRRRVYSTLNWRDYWEVLEATEPTKEEMTFRKTISITIHYWRVPMGSTFTYKGRVQHRCFMGVMVDAPSLMEMVGSIVLTIMASQAARVTILGLVEHSYEQK